MSTTKKKLNVLCKTEMSLSFEFASVEIYENKTTARKAAKYCHLCCIIVMRVK